MRKKKLYKVERFKNEKEWLEHRGIGGSSASAIVNMNPYINCLQLYNSIIYEKEKKSMINESIIYGTKAEPLIRKQYELDFPEYKVRTPKQHEMYRRVDKPYLTATLDGVLVDKKTKRKGILEIKTHDIKNLADDQYWGNNLPQNYFIQVLHYLMVMNDFEFVELVAKLRFYDYFAIGGKKLLRTEYRYYHIERNDESIKKWLDYLEKKETEFFEVNIKNKIPPQISIEL